MLKNLANTFVCLGGAFEIVLGSNLLLHLFALFELLSVFRGEYSGSGAGSFQTFRMRASEEIVRSMSHQQRKGKEGGGRRREELTCSGVTGFWDVLCSSSIVF